MTDRPRVADAMQSMGLTRYGGQVFERMHAAGSGNITASMLPDLFGVGRNGRLAMAAHVLGLLDTSPKDDKILERGHRMQPLAARWYKEKTKIRTHSVHAWAKHPDMPVFASPDSISYHEDYGRWLPGEIKTKAESVFKETWADGPPEDVLIQHQGQLALTGAPAGPVICVVINEHSGGLEIHDWMVEAHTAMQRAILGEASDLLDKLANGELPPPDLTKDRDQDAVIRLARAEFDDVIDLPDELRAWVDLHERQGKLLKRINAKRKEAKARIVDALDGHKAGLLQGLLIQHKLVKVKAHYRDESTSSRLYFKDADKIAKRAA